MKPSIQKDGPEKLTAASAVENEANRLAADRMLTEAVEGFRKLAQQKASRKAPHQAA